MYYYVYILKCSDKHFYTGCTKNIKERLNRHNLGQVPATVGKLPVKLIMLMIFVNKYKAFQFEKYLKSGSGRAFAYKHLT
jgi:putative endonuclease